MHVLGAEMGGAGPQFFPSPVRQHLSPRSKKRFSIRTASPETQAPAPQHSSHLLAALHPSPHPVSPHYMARTKVACEARLGWSGEVQGASQGRRVQPRAQRKLPSRRRQGRRGRGQAGAPREEKALTVWVRICASEAAQRVQGCRPRKRRATGAAPERPFSSP